MLRMDQYEHIRTANRVYGHCISKIARDTGHSRNTIRKALRIELQGYKPRQSQSFPVLGPFSQMIEQWLVDDKEQPKKQRHTARRIYNRLVTEFGFNGSESNVRKFVREARVKYDVGNPKVFIPLAPELGREAEIDWGTAIAKIGGQRTKVKMFCMRSKGSGKSFVRLYPCERQQAFFDGMMQGFAFYGGIFPTLIFDNLTSAVKKVLVGKKQMEQESFTKFRAYHNFTARFCNPGQGHEKGGVEGLVGFARRNFMVPIPEADSLEILNKRILQDCLTHGKHCTAGQQQTINELFEQEKASLVEIPQIPFSNIQSYNRKVDKYATVIIDKNRYSVPVKYSGWQLRSIVWFDRIEIFYQNRKVAEHQRLYNNNQWQLNPDHYLELLQQRPLAFHSARAIKQWKKEWPETMEKLLQCFCNTQGENHGIKDFISVLMLFRNHSANDVYSAIEIALTATISTSDGVKHILLSNQEEPDKIESLSDWPTLAAADISVYEQLGGVT